MGIFKNNKKEIYQHEYFLLFLFLTFLFSYLIVFFCLRSLFNVILFLSMHSIPFSFSFFSFKFSSQDYYSQVATYLLAL